MVYDRETRQLAFANVNEKGERVSVPCSSPCSSVDGGIIVFQASEWSGESSSEPAEITAWKKQQRLPEGEGNHFLYDTRTKTVRRFKEFTEAIAAAHAWFYPITSEDGQYLVTETQGTRQATAKMTDKDAREYSEILLYDVKTGETQPVSTDGRALADQLGLPYYSHEDPSISADGRYISYVTRVSNVKFGASTTPDDPRWKGVIHLAVAIQIYDREMQKTSTVLLATDLPQPAAKEAVTDEATDPFGGLFPPVPVTTVSLHASLLADNGSVTAYEPVLIRVEDKNETDKSVTLRSDAWIERVVIEDARGRVVATSPRESIPANYLVSSRQLKPGESLVGILAVSALYPFSEPGDYTVRVQRTKFQNTIDVLAEDRVAVRVLPFDAARLKARCEALFKHERQSPADRDLSMHDMTRALFSVRHDIALPYIDWHARSGLSTAWEAWIALRLISSPQAIAELDTLAARKDKTGKAVREMMQMPLDRLVWGILGDPDPD